MKNQNQKKKTSEKEKLTKINCIKNNKNQEKEKTFEKKEN